MPSATLQPRSIPRQPRPVRRGSKVSPQRVLPVLLLAGFSLYGLWFVPTAWSVRSSSARQTAAVQPPPEVEAQTDEQKEEEKKRRRNYVKPEKVNIPRI